MTPIAITFMVVAMVVFWGGLVASMLHLRSVPEEED